jgi:hypothetical protein
MPASKNRSRIARLPKLFSLKLLVDITGALPGLAAGVVSLFNILKSSAMKWPFL